MKLKTKGSAKKRVKVTGSGKMIIGHAGKRHRLISKSSRAKGTDKYGHVMTSANTGMLERFMPHSL